MNVGIHRVRSAHQQGRLISRSNTQRWLATISEGARSAPYERIGMIEHA